MSLDISSIIAGAIFGFGIGIPCGIALGMFMYGRVTKESFVRLKAVLSIKK